MFISVENGLIKQLFNFIPEAFQHPENVSYFFNFFIFFQYLHSENLKPFFPFVKRITASFQLLSTLYYYY